MDEQIGIEKTPDAYVAELVAVFREVRRVLKKDGVCWVNLGDSFSGARAGSTPFSGRVESLEPKQLCGIPWRVAFALQADGWWLRQDVIWCLSGGTWLYARTQKGDMPIMLRDAARLDPSTVQLWNGERWTQVLGWSRTKRASTEIEIVLRSGERISCTPTHRFPTRRGLLTTGELRLGDHLQRSTIPQPEKPRDCDHVGCDAAWFAGLYIAEGSMSEDTIQIAGHVKEVERWERLQRIAASYGGYATRSISGNNMTIRLYGKLLRAALDELVTGRTAHDKGIATVCWRYSNTFLRALLDGYLSGDGHWQAENRRWRLGFCRNYNLERDLRTMAARLGFHMVLNLSWATFQKRRFPAFKGEIRFERSGRNQKSPDEIVAIQKARCRELYDIGVADDPHLFALASGILTHNSKPNPMPESVTDRCTKAHEYVFMLTKSAHYFYDQEAIKEPGVSFGSDSIEARKERAKEEEGAKGFPAAERNGIRPPKQRGHSRRHAGFNERWDAMSHEEQCSRMRNKRSVWTVPTQGYKDAHFATFPEALIKPMILAGSRSGDMILDPFGGSGTVGKVALDFGRSATLIELNSDYCEMARQRCNVTVGFSFL